MFDLSSLLSSWAVIPAGALILGAFLESITRMLDALLRWVAPDGEAPKRWRIAYRLARPFLLMLLGVLLGVVGHPLGAPVPDAFGSELGGSILTYVLSAVLALIAYDALKAAVLRSVEWVRVRRNPGGYDPMPPADK